MARIYSLDPPDDEEGQDADECGGCGREELRHGDDRDMRFCMWCGRPRCDDCMDRHAWQCRRLTAEEAAADFAVDCARDDTWEEAR